MNKALAHIPHLKGGEISISGSKSESNRLLILQKRFTNIELNNLSDSDDTKHLQQALNSEENMIDIGHAGTAMRFLTAYFSAKSGREVVLTGSTRMQNRPIKILVEALQALGADIKYIEKDGYPPIQIKGKKIDNSSVKINGNVSSQYISALLLMAPSLENGLELELIGNVTSKPYINMTLNLLKELGVGVSWEKNIIKVSPVKSIPNKILTIESDWSSASYFYSLVALSKKGKVKLSSYKRSSLQGDSSLVEIYQHFGVNTSFLDNSIILTKQSVEIKHLNLDLINSPDLAQTVVVTCFGLGMSCDIIGLHTLKIKETDRLVALKNELDKLGANIIITDKSLHLKSSSLINKNSSIQTYKDHRMAMAFAPLSLKVPIRILEAEVVTKSYTNFWKDLESVLK